MLDVDRTMEKGIRTHFLMPKLIQLQRYVLADLKVAFWPWLVWLGWLEHHPMGRKVTGLIPGWGTSLGCGFNPDQVE